jgi:hypothetical protein
MPLVPTAPALPGIRAGVSLIDDYQFRAGSQELIPPPLAFDEVRRDNDKWINIEERFANMAPLL